MSESPNTIVGKFDPLVSEQIQKANKPLVDAVKQESIQSRATETADVARSDFFSVGNFFRGGDTLPPWWSRARDKSLLDLMYNSNLLGGAMYAMASKLTTIPFHIEPVDMAITKHIREAMRFERQLKESAEFGQGWGIFYQKQLVSLLGQDNGRFMEIIDLSSNKNGPISGPVISVAHLDPARCTRTHNAQFPITYEDTDGKRHRLHWTRVAYEAQMPSIKDEMIGVGICATSRSSHYAQNMLDIATYKEEKLGSRPAKGFVTVGGGLSPKAVGDAFEVSASMSDSRGLTRFPALPIIGSPDIENPSVELTTLSSMPDGFSEKDSTTIAMAAIALGFGVDARELWPGMQNASTRADALLSHVKQRGKAPGMILKETERMFNNWYLPRHLKMVFDFQDDAQDNQKALIRQERARTRTMNLKFGVTTSRVERELMLSVKSITKAQFEAMELEDGRLPDGSPLETLFSSDEPIYTKILTLSGISSPLDIRGNDPQKVLDAISKQLPVAYESIHEETRQVQKTQAKEALAALKFLALKYEASLVIQVREEELTNPSVSPSNTDTDDNSDSDVSPRRNDIKTRTSEESESPLNVNPDDESNMASSEL